MQPNSCRIEGEITSLDLLATLLLIQPNVLVFIWCKGSLCNLLFTGTPRPFCTRCPPACTVAHGYSIPEAGLLIWLCWTSWSFCQPISSLSRSLWRVILSSSISTTPPSWVIPANTVWVHSNPSPRSWIRILNCSDLRHATSIATSGTWQSTHPLYYLVIQFLHQQFVCGQDVQTNPLLSSEPASHLTLEGIGLVRRNLPFVNPYWPISITFLTFMTLRKFCTKTS